MIGQTISHYKVLERLGAGGMGVVYKAEDTKLGRMVALKFLPSDLTRDPEAKQRFILEAKTASYLQHGNICTIHDIDETPDGQLFIVMDYYQGETLKETISKGPLPLDRAVNLAGQIAAGLKEAHDHGIVHRDIKPANILITEKGQVKIMDFGLAKFAGQTHLTRTGSTLGTTAYMSPEQARGDEVDARSDIWSFGVVFFELIAGQRPFSGGYEQAVIYSILNEKPAPLSELRNELPYGVVQVVERLLQKRPQDRYQTMGEVLNDLRILRSKLEGGNQDTDTKKRVPSIAVLPFADMSAQKDQEYFCDGIAEEIINALSHISELQVVARTSAFAFKGTMLDVREIGKKLNVNAVLEGSIRKAGNRLRITAQLITVTDGYHLWSEKFDRDMADIFTIQDEISTAIVDHLKIKWLSGDKTAVQRRSTGNVEAYNLYLKGLYFVARPSIDSYHKALGFFQAGIDKDPNFALAYAGMANVFAGLGVMNLAPPNEMWPKAKEMLHKALSLDQELAEAHAIAAGLAFWYEWDWEAAGKNFDRVLSLNPGDAMSHGMRGWFFLNRRRFNEAIVEIRKALELDPLMPLYYAWSVGLHWSIGMPDQALEEFAKALEIDPHNGLAYFHAGVAYFQKGNLDEALEMLEKGSKLFAPPGWMDTMIGLIVLRKGDRDRAQRILDENIESKKTIKNIAAPCIAWLAGELGHLDLAFEYLDKGYEERDVLMPFIHIYAHVFSPTIVTDSRFKDLLAKMKLDF